MKKLFLFFCFFVSFAQAQPITISFKDQTLPVFLKSVYGDILKSSYLLSPQIASSSTRVNMELIFKDRDDLLARLPSLLATLGVISSMNGSAYMLSTSAGGTAPAPFALPPVAPLPVAHAPYFPSPASTLPPPALTPPPAPPDPVSWHVFKPSNRSPDFICKALFFSESEKSSPACSPAGSAVLMNITKKTFDALAPVLSAIDTPGQRVEISTALAEVTLSTSKGSGLRVVASILGASFEFGTPNVTGSALTFKSKNFSLLLDALQSDQRVVHVVSPSGVVDSGDKLDLSIGDKQPTLGSIQTAGNGLAQQSIQYQTAGAILSVRPTVYSDDLIKLQVESEVSTFSPTTTGVTQSPTISQRKVTTSLTLKSGQAVVLGGLRSAKDSGASHKLFSWSAGSSNSQQSTDLVLMVYAKIITD